MNAVADLATERWAKVTVNHPGSPRPQAALQATSLIIYREKVPGNLFDVLHKKLPLPSGHAITAVLPNSIYAARLPWGHQKRYLASIGFMDVLSYLDMVQRGQVFCIWKSASLEKYPTWPFIIRISQTQGTQ
jgi:hypothetical protein